MNRPIRAALLVCCLVSWGCRGCSTPELSGPNGPNGPDRPNRPLADAGGIPIPAPHAGPPRMLTLSELSEAEKRFGISPEPAAGLTYQPDVVMLPAGVNAIKSQSEDGLVWTLEPNAEGVGNIQPGKVLLLSTKAAGRVLGVQRTEAGVEVVLGPADITEIVRDGSFAIDQAVDLTQALQAALPSAFDPPRPVEPLVSDAAGIDRERYAFTPARFLQAPVEQDFRIIPIASIKGVGAELRSRPNGVLMVAQIVFRFDQPQLTTNLQIGAGTVSRAMVELKGAAGLDVSFEAAAPGPTARNINADRAAPVDLYIPIGGLGIPFALHVRQVFRLQTAFSSTGSVKGQGSYTLTGGIRAEYDAARAGDKFTVSGPKGFTAKEVVLPSLRGALFGPAGIVFVHQVNIMVGVGAAGFVAGPYVYDNNAVTIARGSSLSRPLIPECHRETVTMAVGAGVGWRIPSIVADVINRILKVFRITAQITDGGGVYTKPVQLDNGGWYWPKTQYCGS